MNIEIDDNVLIEKIVEKVVEKITPLLNHNSMSNDNELWDVEKVAHYLDKSKSSIYSKTHTNSIPHLKYGQLLKFNKKHIDIWLRNPYSPEFEAYNLNFNGRKGVINKYEIS